MWILRRSKKGYSKDFKVALAAMYLDNNFKDLESQIFDQAGK